MSQDSAAAPPPQDGSSLGPLGIGAVWGALVSPGATFAALARRPQWVGPFLFAIALVALGSWISLGTTLEFSRQTTEAAMDRMGVPEAERAAALARMPGPDDRSLGTVLQHVGGGAGGMAVFFFAGVGLLHGIARISGRSTGFRGGLALFAGAAVIEGLGHLVKSFLIGASGTVEVSLSPAALLPLLSPDVGYHSVPSILLDALDVFSLWNLAVLVAGAERIYGASRRGALGICGTYWVIKSVFTAGARLFGAWMLGAV